MVVVVDFGAWPVWRDFFGGTIMRRGFLNSSGSQRSPASKADADSRPAVANPDGKECCYLKCKELTHKVWFYRGTDSDRVWVGAEHRCVYIPHSGRSDWTLYKPERPSSLPAAPATS